MMILPPMSSTPRPGDRFAGLSTTWDGVTCTMRWGSSAMLRRRSSRPEPSGAAVPRLVLVANERAVPLSAEDGEIVARLPAGQDGATHAIRTPLNLSRIGVRAFLDPTIDPGSLPPIRLRHPETGLARV